MRVLRPGDHICKRRGATEHHAIYAGDGGIIHFWGIRPDKAAGSIRPGELRAFAGSDGTFEIVEYGRCFDDAEVVRRAHSRLGESGYNVAFKNCEHFARWCKTGESESLQVRRVAVTIGGATGTTAAASIGLAAITGAGAAAGVAGGAQVMAGLASVGGSAVGGIGLVAAAPAAAATIATHRALRDDPYAPQAERDSRRAGRRASTVGAVAGTGASLALVSAAGVPGLSAVGISSGLAALGGTMVGGLPVAGMIPAAAAVLAGFAIYRLRKR